MTCSDGRNVARAWQGGALPGLRPLVAEDAPFFFGRERDLDDLLARVRDKPFVVVVGPSGSGKSSLVGAGLLARLAGDVGGVGRIFRRLAPGDGGENPLLALAAALDCGPERAAAMAERLVADPTALDDLHPEGELLLFVDHLEELFALSSPSYVEPFVQLLVRATRREPFRIVATLQADFYARCLEYEPLALLLRDGTFTLAAPGPDALEQMIARPAQAAGLVYEGDLAGRILRDAGDDPDRLPLVAYTLQALCRVSGCAHSSQGGMLSLAAYEDLGGVRSAIARRAERTYNDPALGDEARMAWHGVIRELVQVDERGSVARRRPALERVAATPGATTLVNALAEAGLLRQGRDANGRAVVEVAHDAVLRGWPRLRQWTGERLGDLLAQAQVVQAAHVWHESGRDRASLWTAERLRPVYAMRDRLPWTPDPLAAMFIRPEAERLLEELEDAHTTHQRRAAIGVRLAEIGDTRPGWALRADGLPDIAWHAVPGGVACVEGREFAVPPFYIARYPVTYAQFHAFVQAPDGWADLQWWTALAEREQVPPEPRVRIANHPHDSVSWNAAMAFCRWLAARLPMEAWPESMVGETAPVGAANGWTIRLPAEWEWQIAATGGRDGYAYPWGPRWDGRYANTWESGLSRTTAVGMYPPGAAEVGPLDMSGNVWEWCLNAYTEPENVSLSAEGRRVARGGSWNHSRNYARCTYRLRPNPARQYADGGFRVVCAREWVGR